jgi:hypothetical protein
MQFTRHSTLLLLLISSLFQLATEAHGQSIYGPGGLFLNPTADFPAKGQFTPAFLVIPQESAALGGRRTWTSYSLDYGLSERIEIGTTYLKVNPGNPPFEDGSLGGYAKYRLFEGQNGGRPDVAIGVSILGGGDVDAEVGFIAARFSPKEPDPRHPAHLHVGLLYADKLNGVTREDVVPYGGFDVGITPELLFFGEARALMEADLAPATAVGFVWTPFRSLKLAIAYANNGWSGGNKLSFGVGYRIGTRR